MGPSIPVHNVTPYARGLLGRFSAAFSSLGTSCAQSEPEVHYDYESCEGMTTAPGSPRRPTRFYHDQVMDSTNPLVMSYRDTPVSGPFATCILRQMTGSAGFQTSCQGRRRRDLGRNCASQAMHRFVSHAFHDVTACFGVRREEFFSKIARESGFQPAALGSGHDGGLGQVTGVFLQQLARPDNFQDMLQHMRSQGEQAGATGLACRNLLRVAVAGPLPASSSQRCQTMYPPENAIRNLIQSANAHRVAREQYIRGPLAGVADAALRDRLAQRAATVAHNNPGNGASLARRWGAQFRGGSASESDLEATMNASAGRIGYYRALVGVARTQGIGCGI